MRVQVWAPEWVSALGPLTSDAAWGGPLVSPPRHLGGWRSL